MSARALVATLFVLMLALALIWCSPQDHPSESQRIEARTFLRALAVDDLADFGFASATEAGSADLVDPIEVVWLDEEGIERAAGASSLDAATPVGREWLYPVVVAGQTRCLVAFDRTGRTWAPSAFGYPALARSVSRLRAQLPPGTSARLARSYAVDFILLAYREPDGRTMAFPITSDRPEPWRPRPLADSLNDILAALKRAGPWTDEPDKGPPGSGLSGSPERRSGPESR
jgi:hypothetical protein